jgi:hypothetical protein
MQTQAKPELRDRARVEAEPAFPNQAAGLVAGTLILTGDGALPVEYLNIGDRVISRKRGMLRLSEHKVITALVDMVRLDPDALGHAVPTTPMVMPAAQQVLLRGDTAQTLADAPQAIWPAGKLVERGLATSLGQRQSRLYILGFEAPDVIYADGMEVVLPGTAAHKDD